MLPADSAPIDFGDAVYLEASISHRHPAPVARELLEVLEALASDGPTDDEMDRMRRRYAWRSRAVCDSGEDVATYYAGEALLTPDGVPITSLEADAEKVMAISRDEVRDMAQMITRPSQLTVIASGPHPRERAAVLAEVTRWASSRRA